MSGTATNVPTESNSEEVASSAADAPCTEAKNREIDEVLTSDTATALGTSPEDSQCLVTEGKLPELDVDLNTPDEQFKIVPMAAPDRLTVDLTDPDSQFKIVPGTLDDLDINDPDAQFRTVTRPPTRDRLIIDINDPDAQFRTVAGSPADRLTIDVEDPDSQFQIVTMGATNQPGPTGRVSVETINGSEVVVRQTMDDGKLRDFKYDNANPPGLREFKDKDGSKYHIADDGSGKWYRYGSYQPENWSNPVAGADGSLTVTNDDGSKTAKLANGAEVVSRNGAVSQIKYADGSSRQINYENGVVASITRQPGGIQEDVRGNNVSVDSKGSLTYTDAQQQVRVIDTTGKTADGALILRLNDTSRVESPSKPVLEDAAIDQAARDLNQALFRKAIAVGSVGVGSNPDVPQISNILEPMTKADRERLAQAYERQFGKPMIEDVKNQLGHVDRARVESILKREDGKPDESGQIHVALARLETLPNTMGNVVSAERALAEKDIRDTLAVLTPQQIMELKEKYAKDHGVDLGVRLQDSKLLSPATKEALAIIMKGNPRSVEDTLQLADIGLNSRRVDIFTEAFRSASPEAREQFRAADGQARIDKAFSNSDRAIAKDYLERGTVSVTTLAAGNAHWYRANTDEITRAVNNASPDERAQFARGEVLQQQINKGENPQLNAQDTKALEFYKSLKEALDYGGTDRQTALWEAKLVKSESVIQNVLEARSESGPHGIIGKTDQNKLFSSVENLSEEDWNRFKRNPQDLERLDRALSTFATEDERSRVMAMMNEKLGKENFKESQHVGRRGVEEVFANGRNAGEKLDALIYMTPTEQHRYRQNLDGFRDKLDSQVQAQFKDGPERLLADRLLQRTASGQSDASLTPEQRGIRDSVDRVLLDAAKTDNPVKTIQDIEEAFRADPTLRDRINKPISEEDKLLSQAFNKAFDRAMQKAHVGNTDENDMIWNRPANHPQPFEVERQELFGKGQLPIEMKLEMVKTEEKKFDLVMNGLTADERARLLTENPDPDTKRFQDDVLGTGDRRQLLTMALLQGEQQPDGTFKGRLTEADRFKQHAIGAGGNVDSLRENLLAMTPEQRQNLANEYFTKYGKLITADVIDKLPDIERWRFRELLSPTDVHARQIPLDARREAARHTSDWDRFLSKHWDYSKIGKDAANDNLTKWTQEHAAELEKLTPEQRKELDKAIQEYELAEQTYIASKGEFAEIFVDATISLAAVGGSLFTGGTSLALLGAVGAGGALYRVGAMKSIQGGDYEDTAHNTIEQALNGGTSAMLGLLGPRELGMSGILSGGKVVTGAEGQAAIAALRNKLLKTGGEIFEEGLAAGVGNVGGDLVTTPISTWDSTKSFDENFGNMFAELAERAPGSFLGGVGGAAAFSTFIKSAQGLVRARVGIDEQGRRFVEAESDGLGVKNATTGEVKSIKGEDGRYYLKDGDELTPIELASGPRSRYGDDVARVERRSRTIVDYVVGDEKFQLQQRPDGWYYPPTDKIAEEAIQNAKAKLHVDTEDPDALRRVQEALIPALETDPELRRLVPMWKTLNPDVGFQIGGQLTDQQAKGFTIYAYTADDARKVAAIIDRILVEKGITLPEPVYTGNVEGNIGQSNRVGLIRDVMEESADSHYEPIALIDDPVRQKIEAQYGGRRLTDAELREVERNTGIASETLRYDSKGKLAMSLAVPENTIVQLEQKAKEYLASIARNRSGMYTSEELEAARKALRLPKTDDPIITQSRDGSIHINYPPARARAYQNGLYADESKAVKLDGMLTGRPAVYALYNKLGFNPADLAPVKEPPWDIRAYMETRGPRPEALPPSNAEKPKVNGNEYEVGRTYTIGSTGASDIKVGTRENGVSGKHAMIRTDASGQTFIADAGSMNGTYVNGERLPPPRVGPAGETQPVWRPIQSGDNVTLGRAALNFKAPGEVALATKPLAGEPLWQSNSFAIKHEESGPLIDGFTNTGQNNRLDADGNFRRGGGVATVVDREADRALQATIKTAEDKFRHINPPEERARQLTEWVHKILTPNGQSQASVDNWYAEFSAQHAGERVLLGEFIARGEGGCTQQAMLLKVLADKLLDDVRLPDGSRPNISLVRGNGTDGKNIIDHAWVNIDLGHGPEIYDPRRRLSTANPNSHPKYKPGSQIEQDLKRGDNAVTHIEPGQEVAFNNTPGWRVRSIDEDGDVVITRDKQSTVEPSKLSEFPENKAKWEAEGMRVGQTYKIRGSDGNVEEWEVAGQDGQGKFIMIQRDRYTFTVSKRELLGQQAAAT